MKRTVTYLIAIFGILLFLAGCNANRLTSPTSSPEPEQATMTARSLPTRTFLPSTVSAKSTSTIAPTPFSTLGVTQIELRGQVVRFWYVGSPSDEIGLMVDTFNSTNSWGLRVDARAFAGYGELNEALDATATQNDLPDLLSTYNYQAAQWDSEGRKLADLNRYINDPVWGLSMQEQADFYPVFWWQDVDAVTSKRYGVPFRRDSIVLFYNVTWAKELGFSKPPVTTKDFERQVCAAAKANNTDNRADNNNTGGWPINTDPSVLTAWLMAFDASLLNANSRYTLNSPESVAALTFLKKLGDEGCTWQSAYASSADTHTNQEFAERKALLMTANSGGLADQQRALWNAENGDEWRVIPFPGVDGKPVVIVRGPGLSIFESTRVRELAAWLFARWLISPESQARRIAAEGGYPTRVSTLEQLKNFASANPQWQQAADLVLYARSEPGLASWSMVRWTFSDALAQLYAPNTKAADIPGILKILDQLAVEAGVQYP